LCGVSGADICLKVLTEVIPVMVEVPSHGPPKVPVQLSDIPYDRFYSLPVVELVPSRELLVFSKKVWSSSGLAK